MAHLTAARLVESGALPPRVLEACAGCIRDRRTILVTGASGTGKTTLLRALLRLVPEQERLMVLGEGGGGLDRDAARRERTVLVRADPTAPPKEAVARGLRQAPRLPIVGDFCPSYACEILRGLRGGRHHGSLLAVGAESPDAALRRLAAWSLADGCSWDEACHGVGAGIDLVVGVTRSSPGVHGAAGVARVEACRDGWTLRAAGGG